MVWHRFAPDQLERFLETAKLYGQAPFVRVVETDVFAIRLKVYFRACEQTLNSGKCVLKVGSRVAIKREHAVPIEGVVVNTIF